MEKQLERITERQTAQYKLLRSAFIVLKDENKSFKLKGVCDFDLRNHSINLIESFKDLRDFDEIQKYIVDNMEN